MHTLNVDLTVWECYGRTGKGVIHQHHPCHLSVNYLACYYYNPLLVINCIFRPTERNSEMLKAQRAIRSRRAVDPHFIPMEAWKVLG